MTDLPGITGETLFRGIIGKVTGLFSGKVLLYGIAVVSLFAGVQTLRLAWADSRIARMEAAHKTAVAKAVETALEAERAAQAKHDKREDKRRADTADLHTRAKEAADANPIEAGRSAGPATRAVLGSLRATGTDTKHPAR